MTRTPATGFPMPTWKEKTIALAHPIRVGERSIAALTLFEPNVDAMEAIEEIGFVEGQKATVKQMRAAVVALSRETPEAIGKLHRDDFAALAEAAVPLLSESTDGAADKDSTDQPSIPSAQTAPTS